MADFVVAVRTYKRYKAFISKTYQMLKENDLLDRLYIFVANEEEKQLYLEALADKEYKELIVGVPGCAEVGNFIVNYFPVGKPIVFLDDDLCRFFVFDSTGVAHRRASNLKNYILDGFKTLEETGTNGFSFSYISNRLWLKGKPFKEFRPWQMSGCFYGCFNDPGMLIVSTGSSHCEDSVRTVQVLEKYGGVLLYWWAGFETYYCKDPGGIQATSDRDDTKATTEYFLQNTPNAKLWLKPPQLVKQGVWQLKILPLRSIIKNLASVGRTLTTRSFAWENFASL